MTKIHSQAPMLPTTAVQAPSTTRKVSQASTGTTRSNDFQTFQGSPPPTPQPASATGSTVTPLGLLAFGQAELAVVHNQLLQNIEKTASTFPEEARKGVALALEKSVNRILEAESSEKISPQEAAESLEMMREMMEGLHDIRTNNVELLKHDIHNENVQVWTMQAPDGDEFIVTARTESDEKGEARVSFRSMKDDGQKLKGRHRMGMRLDLEKFGSASVDVQFGSSSLNKRVHGLYRNEDGSVFETDSGKKLADHHFRDGLPESLQQPARFAEMVQTFVQKTMGPLQSDS